MSRRVAILIFDDVEVLDFCGPFEVFSVAGRVLEGNPFDVFTVGMSGEEIRTRGRMVIRPTYAFANCPPAEILIVPGGLGARSLLTDSAALEWVEKVSQQSEITMSVCSGALILGQIGLLDGLAVTTHHSTFDLLAEVAPKAQLVRDQRYLDRGRIITSAGISAGIDASLYMVGRLHGSEAASKVASWMEYKAD